VSLDLAGNAVGAEGAAALASALSGEQQQLTELNMDNNHIGEEGG
jgi:hypothetical protein